MSVATRHQIDIGFEESSGAGMRDGFFDLKTPWEITPRGEGACSFGAAKRAETWQVVFP